eukprot:3958580-Lingulodinium_polyedra.AAC.1
MRHRPALLAEQLRRKEVLIAGLAETRMQAGLRLSANYLCFASGADEAHALGMEVWLSRATPYCTQGGHPRFFEARHVS